MKLRPVDDYGRRLRQAMDEIAPEGVADPQVVLLSPGIYNSAYFEHVFLAREMGVPLVEGADLVVEDDRVWMRTTGGLRRGAHHLPPHQRRLPRPDRVPAGQHAGRARPDRRLAARQRHPRQRGRHRRRRRQGDLRLHAAHHPLLPRRGPDPAERARPTSAASRRASTTRSPTSQQLVVKPVGESGGYGITVGPRASARRARDGARGAASPNPANWISQPMIGLSVAPTLTDAGLRPRHLDLRPFAITGRDTWVLPGGLIAGRVEGGQHRSSTRPRAAAPRTPGCSPNEPARAPPC